MKSNGLKADQVIAAGNGARNRCRPAVVLGNHLSGTPGTSVHSPGQKSRLINLELKLEVVV